MENQELLKIVTLNCYKAKAGSSQLLYDANGNVHNEKFPFKISYGVLEWKMFIKNIKTHGFIKIEVDNVKERLPRKANQKAEYRSIETPEYILKEIKSALNSSDTAVRKTPEQKRIEELEKKIEELISAKAPAKRGPKPKSEKNQID